MLTINASSYATNQEAIPVTTTGPNKWSGGAAVDSIVYGVPLDASAVLAINTSTNTLTTHQLPGTSPDDYSSSVAAYSYDFEGTGGTSSCTDTLTSSGAAWTDSGGSDGCSRYVSSSWCSPYGNGYANSDGQTANMMCCGCGGGTTVTSCDFPGWTAAQGVWQCTGGALYNSDITQSGDLILQPEVSLTDGDISAQIMLVDDDDSTSNECGLVFRASNVPASSSYSNLDGEYYWCGLLASSSSIECGSMNNGTWQFITNWDQTILSDFGLSIASNASYDFSINMMGYTFTVSLNGQIIGSFSVDSSASGVDVYRSGNVGFRTQKALCHYGSLTFAEPNMASTAVCPDPSHANCAANKWSAGVRVGNKIFGIPLDANNVLVIDTDTADVSAVNISSLSGAGTWPCKWSGGVAVGSFIYGIPLNSDSVLLVDTVSGTVDTSTITGAGVARNKWSGGVLYSDGHQSLIYCIPLDASYLLVIDTMTNSLHHVGSVGKASNKWSGGVLIGSTIYGFPRGADSILEIKLSTVWESYSEDWARQEQGCSQLCDSRAWCKHFAARYSSGAPCLLAANCSYHSKPDVTVYPQNGGWVEHSKVSAPDPSTGGRFATSMSLRGNQLVIGGYKQSTGLGTAYAYTTCRDLDRDNDLPCQETNEWRYDSTLSTHTDRFGIGVGLGSRGAVVGGSGKRAYAFFRLPGYLTQIRGSFFATEQQMLHSAYSVDRSCAVNKSHCYRSLDDISLPNVLTQSPLLTGETAPDASSSTQYCLWRGQCMGCPYNNPLDSLYPSNLHVHPRWWNASRWTGIGFGDDCKPRGLLTVLPRALRFTVGAPSISLTLQVNHAPTTHAVVFALTITGPCTLSAASFLDAHELVVQADSVSSSDSLSLSCSAPGVATVHVSQKSGPAIYPNTTAAVQVFAAVEVSTSFESSSGTSTLTKLQV